MSESTFYNVVDGLGNTSPLYMSQVGLIVQPQSVLAKAYAIANPTTQVFGVNGWGGSGAVNAISVLANGTVTINGFSNTAAIAAAYVQGSSTATYVPFYTGALAQSGDSNFIWDNTGKALLLGIAAHTDYPAARAVFSKGVADGLDAENHNIGSVGLGLATTSATPNITTGWGVGFYGKGWTNGTARSGGVIGEGMVTASADTGTSIGVRGYAQQTHAGGLNIGLYGSASGGSSNYALYNNAGDFYSAASHSWIFGGTTSSTLSLYNGTHLGGTILLHDTPTSSVFTWYGSMFSGTITPNANITYNLGSAVALYTNIYGNNLLAEGGAGKGIKIGDAAHTSLIQTDGVNNGIGIGGAPNANYMLSVTGAGYFSAGIISANALTFTTSSQGILNSNAATVSIGGLRTYTTAINGLELGRYGSNNIGIFTGTTIAQTAVASFGNYTPSGNTTSSAFNAFTLNYTINTAAFTTTTSTATGLKIVATETAIATLTHRMIDVYAGAAGTTNIAYITNAGNFYGAGSYTSGAPTGGTSGAWKFGILVTAVSAFDTTRYIQLDIGGTLYKVAVCS